MWVLVGGRSKFVSIDVLLLQDRFMTARQSKAVKLGKSEC